MLYSLENQIQFSLALLYVFILEETNPLLPPDREVQS